MLVEPNSSVILDEQTFANEILLEFHLSPMLVKFHLQYDQILNIIDEIALYIGIVYMGFDEAYIIESSEEFANDRAYFLFPLDYGTSFDTHV